MLNLPLVFLNLLSLPLQEKQMQISNRKSLNLTLRRRGRNSEGSSCTSSPRRSSRSSSSDVFLLQVNFFRTVSCSFCRLL